MKPRLLACSFAVVACFTPRMRGADADATALAVGRAYLKYQTELRAALPKAGANEGQWWKSTSNSPPWAVEMNEKFAVAEREFRATIRATTGTAVIPPGAAHARLFFLPQEKQDAVAQVEASYAARVAEVRAKAGNFQLASDAERLRGFAVERDQAIAAALTPEEWEMYQLRVSSSSGTLRGRYGEAIESLEEFKKLFALQKAFDEKYAPELMMMNPALGQTRMDDERKLMEQMMAALGPARAAAFRRASDSEYLALKALVRRLHLAENTPEAVLDMRENYAGVSMAINNQAAINPSDRRTLLQEVEKEARQKLTELLGKEAFEAYQRSSQWLRYLESGMAFSTDPKDSPSGGAGIPGRNVFIVPPGYATRTTSGATGGTFISSSGGTSTSGGGFGGGGGGSLPLAPAVPIPSRTNTQPAPVDPPASVSPTKK